jgi:hypothetical protein
VLRELSFAGADEDPVRVDYHFREKLSPSEKSASLAARMRQGSLSIPRERSGT